MQLILIAALIISVSDSNLKGIDLKFGSGDYLGALREYGELYEEVLIGDSLRHQGKPLKFLRSELRKRTGNGDSTKTKGSLGGGI